ncbi:thymidine kinase [Brachybacterium atlanticum]|uniref:thymidine kinase n=1 Tax=Brachybacterium atlanticum TaxID=2911888 RepID=UPI0021E0DABB|nr:thymidine kinase [Brachybacterium atlanticum]
MIAGPMFAGKTEELLRRVHRARLAGRRVEVVGHSLDDRGGAERLSTHLGRSVPARMLEEPHPLLDLLDGDTAAGEEGATPEAQAPDGGVELLALDEAQFFGPALVPVLERLLEAGIDVAVAGLCLTYDGEPFSPLPELMARAEEVVKLTAVCTVCGADAAFHIRLVDDGADAHRATAAQVGGGESYRARCRAHRDPALRERGPLD